MTTPGRRHALVALAGILVLGACAGVPLRTLARLRTLRPDDLLAADPREFGVALDVDARVKAASGRSPVVDLALRPVEESAFAPLVQVLACEPETAVPRDLGLPKPRSGRHWIAYRLAEPSAHDLAIAQSKIREIRERKRPATLSVSVRNDWIAEVYPAALGSEVSTWVRMKRAEGYFELWSGRVPPLPAQA